MQSQNIFLSYKNGFCTLHGMFIVYTMTSIKNTTYIHDTTFSILI